MHQDLTKGEIKQQIKSVGVPASVGFFFYTMFNITDMYYAGYLGNSAIASLALCGVVFFTIISVASGLSKGATALVGNAIGEDNIHKAQSTIVNSYYLAVILSVILYIFAYFYMEVIFTFTNASGEYLKYALIYINIIFYGVGFYIFTFFSNSILVALGDSKSFRNVLIGNFFLNIVLTSWFVLGGFGINPMGIKGIALATVIVEFFAMSFLVYKISTLKIIKDISSYKIEFEILYDLFKQGLPTTANNLLMSSGAFILMYFLSNLGESYVSAYGIGIRIEQIALLPGIGLSVAIAAMVAQNNGAKNYDRIEEIMKQTYKYVGFIFLIGFIFMFFLASFLASYFTSDLSIIYEASTYIKINAVLLYAYIIIFINVSFLQAIKRPNMIFYIGLIRQVILPISLYSLAYYYDMDIIYYWMATFVSVSIATIYIHYLQKKYLKEMINENIS